MGVGGQHQSDVDGDHHEENDGLAHVVELKEGCETHEGQDPGVDVVLRE